MDAVEKYIIENSSQEDELLVELERVTNQRTIHPQMISGHVQGSILKMLTRMIAPRNVLEIGTFTGYSAISIAGGLPEGATLDTIEANDQLEDLILSFFERSCHAAKLRLHIGSALQVAPTLGKQYDLVFMDGDKREYPAYYRMLMGDGNYSASGRLIRSGSYIIADNILWYGKVSEEGHNDPQTQAIIEFNRMVKEDPRVDNIIVPLRDGLNLIRVK